MQNIIYLMRYKREEGRGMARPLAYAHDIDEVRDFFERAGERTHDPKNLWFIGFTEHFTYPITKLPTLKQFESAGAKPNGKY